MRRHTKVKALLAAFSLLLLTANMAQAAGVTLSWTAPVKRVDNTDLLPGNIAGYNIYYGDVTGYYQQEVNIPIASLADPLKPAYTITGLITCQVYYLVLTTFDVEGRESSYSPEITTAALDTPVVSPPQPSGTDGLQISWTNVAPLDPSALQNYAVYYDTESGEPYQGTGATQGGSPINVASDSTSLQLTGLGLGNTYVVVDAICPDGTTSRSEEVSGVVGTVIADPDSGISQPDSGLSQPDTGILQPDTGINPLPDAGIPDSGVESRQSNSTLSGGCAIAATPSMLPLALLLALALLLRRR
ncbi:MAG: hypothetical protein JRH20_19820 [Deltaproteobacteria bacterium]|nr:hypothetical protein [Deltaproteobacteria bacterium]